MAQLNRMSGRGEWMMDDTYISAYAQGIKLKGMKFFNSAEETSSKW